MGYEEGQSEQELKKSAEDPRNQTEEERKGATLACMFISGADKYMYGYLNIEQINDYAKCVDNWPTNVDEAVQLLQRSNQE